MELCFAIFLVQRWLRQENCKLVALSSGLERIDAHRFYQERMNYNKPAYVFKKIIRKTKVVP